MPGWPRADPDQFQPVPFPAKVLKLLLHEAQTAAQTSSQAKGVPDDAVSDDEDDEWADEGAEFTAGNERDLDFLSGAFCCTASCLREPLLTLRPDMCLQRCCQAVASTSTWMTGRMTATTSSTSRTCTTIPSGSLTFPSVLPPSHSPVHRVLTPQHTLPDAPYGLLPVRVRGGPDFVPPARRDVPQRGGEERPLAPAPVCVDGAGASWCIDACVQNHLGSLASSRSRAASLDRCSHLARLASCCPAAFCDRLRTSVSALLGLALVQIRACACSRVQAGRRSCFGTSCRVAPPGNPTMSAADSFHATI